VKIFIGGLGRLDFKHLLALNCIKFYKSVASSSCNKVLQSLCYVDMLSSWYYEFCCIYDVHIDLPYSVLRHSIMNHFVSASGVAELSKL
jgi:hypothetical protein